MLTRQNNSTTKALRNTQKKGKAFRIRTNAIIKKTARERDIAKGTIAHLLPDYFEAEDECLALKKRIRKLKNAKKLEKHAMMRERVAKAHAYILPAVIGILQAAVVVFAYTISLKPF
jgi:hypothetical protein